MRSRSVLMSCAALAAVLAATDAQAQGNNSPASVTHSFGVQTVSAGAGTYFLRPWHESFTADGSEVFIRCPRAGTVRNLFVQAFANHNSISSAVVTVRKNGVDQTLTATLAASGTQASDTTDTFAVAQGDQLSVKIVQNAGSNGTIVEVHAIMIMVEDTVVAVTAASSGTAVTATATGAASTGVNGSGVTYGVYASASDTDGYGVHGTATGTGGTGVYGSGLNGVYGASSSTGGVGVYANQSSTSSGWGVYSTGFNGLEAKATASTGWGVIADAYVEGHQALEANGNSYFNGDVGIGTSAPTHALQLTTDDAVKPTTNTWTISSDGRLKKNVETISEALNKMLALHGVTFEWREPEKFGNATGRHMGMIAQEVEQVIPEWVGVDRDGYKTLKIGGFEGLTAESIRTLKGDNDRLAHRIEQLEARLTRLEETPSQRAATFVPNGPSGWAALAVGVAGIALGFVFGRRRHRVPS